MSRPWSWLACLAPMSLHTQAETARHVVEEKHAHHLMIIKANQPSLPEAVTNALAGTDADFTGTSWTEEGKGHGRREKRSIRTVPAAGTGWPHAAQVMRIHRACSGPGQDGLWPAPSHGAWPCDP